MILLSEIKHFYLLAKQRIQLFWDVVLFVFNLCLSQSDGNVWISFPINVSWMQISCLPPKKPKKQDDLKMKWVVSLSPEISTTVRSWKCRKVQKTYPDNIDAYEDVNGIVVRDVLKHSHVGVKVHLSGHVVWHFVHAQWALKGCN